MPDEDWERIRHLPIHGASRECLQSLLCPPAPEGFTQHHVLYDREWLVTQLNLPTGSVIRDARPTSDTRVTLIVDSPDTDSRPDVCCT